MKLLLETLCKFAAGVAAVTLLVFLPAGTLRYPGGWLMLGVLFLPMAAFGILLYRKAPQLLRRRLQGRERSAIQKRAVGFSGLLFLAVFVLSGLDYRFGWSHLPLLAQGAAAAVFLGGYALYGVVLFYNEWLSRTVVVEQGQQLVDSGPYAVVRHPMYLATVLMFCTLPLVLGSVWAFALQLGYPLLLVGRIRDEEQLLHRELAGYTDYCQRVKYRMVPYIW